LDFDYDFGFDYARCFALTTGTTPQNWVEVEPVLGGQVFVPKNC
jgi:hypothetical protein